MSIIKPFVAELERRFSDRPWFFRLYAAPYRRLVRREVRLARVGRDDTLLSIGCGALPFTAVLAHVLTGARVIAVDIDRNAAERARRLVHRMGRSGMIEVAIADASTAALPSADVALVALQASPKDEIWRNLHRSLRAGSGRAVFRLPRATLVSEYGSFTGEQAAVGRVRHRMPTFDRSVLCVPAKKEAVA